MSLLHPSAPYRRRVRDQMPVPAVLPLVQVRITDGGLLDVTINQSSYVTDPSSAREDLHRVLDQITRELASPVKLEIHEPDGSVFTDIVTPNPRDAVHRASQTPPAVQTNVSTAPGEVAGDGFLPHEEVAIAVVVAQQPAQADGTARLRLPPALLAGRPGSVVLFGRSSGAVAVSSAAADAVAEGVGAG